MVCTSVRFEQKEFMYVIGWRHVYHYPVFSLGVAHPDFGAHYQLNYITVNWIRTWNEHLNQRKYKINSYNQYLFILFGYKLASWTGLIRLAMSYFEDHIPMELWNHSLINNPIFYDIQIITGEKITICYRIHLEVSSVNVILVFHWIEAWGSLFEKH